MRLNRSNVQRRISDVLGECPEDTLSKFDMRSGDRTKTMIQSSLSEYVVPDHQRHYAWDLQSMGPKLIESVMQNFPMPSFIMSAHDLDGRRIYHIEDGQHRLVTLQQYILGAFSWNGKKFAELSKKQEREFLGYILQCEIIEHPTTLQVAQIFERINSCKPLTSNDKYHNMRCAPLMIFIMENLVQHVDFREMFTKYVSQQGVGKGKTRTLLSDIVGAVVPLITGSMHNISLSYEVNGPLLGLDIATEHMTKVRLVFRSYFTIISSMFQGEMNSAPKRNYGKLNGMLGLFIFSKTEDGLAFPISDDCWRWYAFHSQTNKFTKLLFATVDGADRSPFRPSVMITRLRHLHDVYSAPAHFPRVMLFDAVAIAVAAAQDEGSDEDA